MLCLDKGFVAPIELSNTQSKLKKLAPNDGILRLEIDSLLRAENAHLLFKCPLFVQLNLSKFGFNIINVSPEELDAYEPDITDIKSGDLSTAKDIAEDIKQTTAALLINPKAYQADGCDRFTSQLITPINTYTTILVSGNLQQWVEFYNQKNIPKPILSYTEICKEIIEAHWQDLRNGKKT